MKKGNYRILPALTLSLAMLGSVAGYSSAAYAAEGTEVKKVQEIEIQNLSTAAVYDEDKFKLPDEAEIEANKKLKEVMEQWKESGEYPDYFADCVFLGEEFLYPVIQLTDVSEETKQDFFERVGFEHEKWQFLEVPHSRKELLEFMSQVEADFGSDERVEKIVLPEIAQVKVVYLKSYTDGVLIEYRPDADDAEPLKIWVYAHNEYEAEVSDDVKNKYVDANADKVGVDINEEDAVGKIITEENVLPGRSDYIRQYQINDIRDAKYYDMDFCDLVGDANGNGQIDLEDAQRVLRDALKIYDVYQLENRYFWLRFSEDHKGVDLSDAQEILKRALKIEEDTAYVDILNTSVLYRSLEFGRIDKPVVNKIVSGREELLEYVRELNNPDLEQYVTNLAGQYVDDKEFIICATPVYSEAMDGISPNGAEGNYVRCWDYYIKYLPDSQIVFPDLVDETYAFQDSKSQYYIEICVMEQDFEEQRKNVTMTMEPYSFLPLGDIHSYNPEQDLKAGYYVIRSKEELEVFNKTIGNGFEITRNERDYFDYNVLIVSVTDYSSYPGECDKFNLSYTFEDGDVTFIIDREKYLSHNQTKVSDYKGNYVDVIDFSPYSFDMDPENFDVKVQSDMKYTYIDYAPQQQTFVIDYSGSNERLEGLVRITNEDEKEEVLNYLEKTFSKDHDAQYQAMIEAVEKLDVSAKEYVIAFDGNKGNVKKELDNEEQMYVTFLSNSLEVCFNMEGSSFEPGKQIVTLMSFEKGTLRNRLAGNVFIQSTK